MLTTYFPPMESNNVLFPFNHHSATSESNQLYTESIETHPFKATITSFKTLLNKTHPNNSKRGTDNFLKGLLWF